MAWVGYPGRGMSYLLLTLEGATGMDEYVRTLNICARDFDLDLNKQENDNDIWDDRRL